MKIKGVIFDFGGTLDTAGCHWGMMLWRAYQIHQVPVSEPQFREAYVFGERTLGQNPIIQAHDTFRKMLDVKIKIEMEYLRDKGIWTCDEQLCRQKNDAILDDLYGQVVSTTRMSREVLLTLKDTLPLVLVSNFYGNMSVVLEEFGMNGIFSQIIESAVVGIRKPDSRIFQMGVEAMGLQPEEVLVVGDSLEKDIAPAQHIGCKTAWLEGEGWAPVRDASIVPDWTIHTIKEVKATL